MQKRRRLILILVAVAVLVVFAVIVSFSPSEPRFNGRPLRSWVDELGSNDAQDRSNATEAIRHIGTNGLPCLLEWIRYEPPDWKLQLHRAAGRLPNGLEADWMKQDQDALRLFAAAEAIAKLGPEAKTAVPELTRLMTDPKAGFSAIWATYSLAHLGPEGLHPLMTVLTNHQMPIHKEVLINMPFLGTNARPAVPLLIQCLNDKDEFAAHLAALALGRLRLDSAVVVPALSYILEDSRPRVRISGANALGRFADEARPAVPALLKLFKDPDPKVRDAATNALNRVDPQALEKVANQ